MSKELEKKLAKIVKRKNDINKAKDEVNALGLKGITAKVFNIKSPTLQESLSQKKIQEELRKKGFGNVSRNR